DFELLADGLADGQCDFNRRFAGGGQIKVTLVNRSLLNIRGEVVRVRKHPGGELFITLEVAGENNEFRAEFARPHGRHGSINAEFSGLIRRRCYDASLYSAH